MIVRGMHNKRLSAFFGKYNRRVDWCLNCLLSEDCSNRGNLESPIENNWDARKALLDRTKINIPARNNVILLLKSGRSVRIILVRRLTHESM